MTMETFTVVGFWADNEQRCVDFFTANTPREAEEMMLAKAADDNAEFRIAGTLPGENFRSCTYTAYLDPDDEDNNARTDLIEPADELEPVEWTVVGVVTGTREHLDKRWNARTGGERYLGHHMAVSAKAAEGVARSVVAERGRFKLAVCAVFEGTRFRRESFPYANHDVEAR